MAPQKSLLTINEAVGVMAAAGYVVAAETVRRWVREGRLKVVCPPCVTKGSRMRVRRDEIEAILQGEYQPDVA